MASGVAFTGRILKKICDSLLASGGESLLGHVIMLSHTWANRLFDCLFPQHLTISVGSGIAAENDLQVFSMG